MKKFIILLFVVLALFVSCDDDLLKMLDGATLESDTGKVEPPVTITDDTTDSKYERIDVFGKLDYLTNIYYSIDMYAVNVSSSTFKDVIPEKTYSVLYTKNTYDSTKESKPILDLNTKLDGEGVCDLYTECRDTSNDVTVIYAYKTSDGSVRQEERKFSKNEVYSKYIDTHSDHGSTAFKVRRASDPMNSIYITPITMPREGDMIYLKDYDIGLYVINNDTYSHCQRDLNAYTRGTLNAWEFSSVLTFNQNGFVLYDSDIYSDISNYKNAGNKYPESEGQVWYVYCRQSTPTIFVDGIAREFRYARSLYSQLEWEWCTGDLYTERYYDSTRGETSNTYKIDASNTYVEDGDVVYTSCKDINLVTVTVTINGNPVELLESKSFKKQGYSEVYMVQTYVDTYKNFADTTPYEGQEVWTTKPVCTRVKATLVDNSTSSEIQSTIYLDSEKDYKSQGYAGWYYSDCYDYRYSNAENYKIDSIYPQEGDVIYSTIRSVRNTVYINNVAVTVNKVATYKSLGYSELYTQSAYNPDDSQKADFKIDIAETFAQNGDRFYTSCVEYVKVYIDYDMLRLDPTRSYAAQGYTALYTKVDYYDGHNDATHPSLASITKNVNDKPVQGDVLVTTVNKWVEIEIEDNTTYPSTTTYDWVRADQSYSTTTYADYYNFPVYENDISEVEIKNTLPETCRSIYKCSRPNIFYIMIDDEAFKYRGAVNYGYYAEEPSKEFEHLYTYKYYDPEGTKPEVDLATYAEEGDCYYTTCEPYNVIYIDGARTLVEPGKSFQESGITGKLYNSDRCYAWSEHKHDHEMSNKTVPVNGSSYYTYCYEQTKLIFQVKGETEEYEIRWSSKALRNSGNTNYEYAYSEFITGTNSSEITVWDGPCEIELFKHGGYQMTITATLDTSSNYYKAYVNLQDGVIKVSNKGINN